MPAALLIFPLGLRAKTHYAQTAFAAGIGLRAFCGALRPMPAMRFGVLIAYFPPKHNFIAHQALANSANGSR